jgi:hypothetical protein
MDKDCRGRRRGPDQERGLRPLYPLLPEQWTSKALRVAMSAKDWARFEALVQSVSDQAPTHARACGITLSHLMQHAPAAEPAPGPLDWMDWERRKTLQLLRSAV